MQQATFKFAKAMEGLDLKSFMEEWETSVGFPIIPISPLHTLYYLLTYQRSIHFINRRKNPSKFWTPRLHSRLDLFDVRSLPAVDCDAFGVEVKASNVPHVSVECGVLSCSLFGAGEIVG